MCIDNWKDRSKHTFIINGSGHSSDVWKILKDFGSKYSKISPTKDQVHDPVAWNKFKRQKQNDDNVNNAVDEIIKNNNIKVSVVAEAHENIESEIYENDKSLTWNMSLDEKKEKKKWRNRAF